MLSCRSKGERKYKLKMAELGLKRDELRRLGLDYQRRMKLKEVSLFYHKEIGRFFDLAGRQKGQDMKKNY